MDKPILYIDVDGVLFGIYGEYATQLRPNVVGFLTWCMKNFECRWMTAWGQAQLYNLFKLLYAPDIAKGIRYYDWRGFKAPRGFSFEKDDTIELTEDFYWIEDGPVRDKLKGLVDSSGHMRYIEVSAHGADALNDTKIYLVRRLRDREIEVIE